MGNGLGLFLIHAPSSPRVGAVHLVELDCIRLGGRCAEGYKPLAIVVVVGKCNKSFFATAMQKHFVSSLSVATLFDPIDESKCSKTGSERYCHIPASESN